MNLTIHLSIKPSIFLYEATTTRVLDLDIIQRIYEGRSQERKNNREVIG